MKNERAILIGTVLAAALVWPAAAVFSRELPGGLRERLKLEKEIDGFIDVIALVRSEYVDEVPFEKLFSGALSGMLRSLDPYSQYLDADAYRDLKVDTEGQFGGIGLEVSVKGGHLHVIAPLEDMPAAAAGVLAGDSIIRIDGESTRDIALSDAVKRMRGPAGSVVALTVMREGEAKLLEFSVPRAMILVKSIKEARLIGDGVAYLRLSAFQENTPEDLKLALRELISQGMKGLILDLRNNAGGLLTAAVNTGELFLDEGKVAVSTRGRQPSKSSKYVSRNKEPFRIHPFVVLVNRGSASGSEILAGMIQDHKLGVVIGSKTFGKASVQTLIPLPDGSAIRLTTSKYYTPGGRLLHEAGITPDIAVADEPAKSGVDPALERAIAFAREMAKASAP